MVEGALVLLLLFVFLFAVFEVGRLIQVQQALTDAAREGARRSIAPLTQTSILPTPADVTSFVEGYLEAASLDKNLATITVDQSVTLAGSTTQYSRVTVTYPYQVMTIRMFGMLNMNLTGSSLMRNETSP
jgi:Flp pilus assembly protein TadG